ncbi:hypothetical protein OUZ56_000152 [Daphnia magna]|uniref:Uncharacterized protein n=1 Tax=Daphnia magna TaxID=35525 RepID=A0ABQ9ZZ07_9CRUS|nr:hypothetical protein OUZ56_000152 [Daphnia magna]
MADDSTSSVFKEMEQILRISMRSKWQNNYVATAFPAGENLFIRMGAETESLISRASSIIPLKNVDNVKLTGNTDYSTKKKNNEITKACAAILELRTYAQIRAAKVERKWDAAKL